MVIIKDEGLLREGNLGRKGSRNLFPSRVHFHAQKCQVVGLAFAAEQVAD
jgi:hypothetical protein